MVIGVDCQIRFLGVPEFVSGRLLSLCGPPFEGFALGTTGRDNSLGSCSSVCHQQKGSTMSSTSGLPLLAEGVAQLEEQTAGFDRKITQFVRNALEEWVTKPQTKDEKDYAGYVKVPLFQLTALNLDRETILRMANQTTADLNHPLRKKKVPVYEMAYAQEMQRRENAPVSDDAFAFFKNSFTDPNIEEIKYILSLSSTRLLMLYQNTPKGPSYPSEPKEEEKPDKLVPIPVAAVTFFICKNVGTFIDYIAVFKSNDSSHHGKGVACFLLHVVQAFGYEKEKKHDLYLVCSEVLREYYLRFGFEVMPDGFKKGKFRAISNRCKWPVLSKHVPPMVAMHLIVLMPRWLNRLFDRCNWDYSSVERALGRDNENRSFRNPSVIVDFTDREWQPLKKPPYSECVKMLIASLGASRFEKQFAEEHKWWSIGRSMFLCWEFYTREFTTRVPVCWTKFDLEVMFHLDIYIKEIDVSTSEKASDDNIVRKKSKDDNDVPIVVHLRCQSCRKEVAVTQPDYETRYNFILVCFTVVWYNHIGQFTVDDISDTIYETDDKLMEFYHCTHRRASVFERLHRAMADDYKMKCEYQANDPNIALRGYELTLGYMGAWFEGLVERYHTRQGYIREGSKHLLSQYEIQHREKFSKRLKQTYAI